MESMFMDPRMLAAEEAYDRRQEAIRAYREEYNKKGLEGMRIIYLGYIMYDNEQFFKTDEFEAIMASGKADVNTLSTSNYPPIHIIATTRKENAPEILEILLRYHPGLVNVRAPGVTETPLHTACAFGSVGTTRVLLKHRADPLAVDYSRRTPSDYAQLHSWVPSEDVTQLLEQAKANMRSCFSCEAKPEKLLRCGACKVAFYCNKDHQASHWPIHKKICASYRDTRKVPTLSLR